MKMHSSAGLQNIDTTKGQLISKAIYGVLDSPKKQTKKIWLDVS